MRNGALLERMTLVRLTSETDSGSLPTPVKYDSSDWGQKEGNNYHGLGWQAANVWGKADPLLPTPNRWDMKAWDGQNQENLTNRVLVEEGIWQGRPSDEKGKLAERGLWPTVTANMKSKTTTAKGNTYGNGQPTLISAVQSRSRAELLPTVLKADSHATWKNPGAHKAGNPTLLAALKNETLPADEQVTATNRRKFGRVKLWDTPCKGDAHPRAYNRTRIYDGEGQEHLQSQAMRSLAEQGESIPDGGKLNPTWVEWLMGWPMGWTGLQPLETDRFQQWLSLHGITSPTE
jgi:hypothetical protein